MATIRERRTATGTTTFHVQVRVKGAPSQTATFRRLTDARRWAQRIEADLRDGRHFPGTAARRYTVADLIDRYRQTILPQKKRQIIAAQTPQFRWWQARLGHLRLSGLTPAVVADARDALLATYGHGTVNRYLAAFGHACSVATREWQWLDTNLVHLVSKPREPQGRVRFLSDDERSRLLTACQRSPSPWLYAIVLLALTTGGRKMEILTLRWPDVDVHRGRMTLHDTKNGERRALTLTGHPLTIIREHAKVRRLDTDLLFPRRDGRAPLDIRPGWVTAYTEAGLTDFRFHDLRHTFASYLAMNGASLAELAEALGHKSFDMVKRYAHLSEQHTATVVARMTAQVFGEA